MEERFKPITHEKFVEIINKLSCNLSEFLTQNNLKIDYVVPILRSGAVPAVYIANKLNIVKFAPFQVKNVKFNSGKEKHKILFSAFDTLKINKPEPVFLMVDGTHFSGKSAELCINEIYKTFPNAKILYVCLQRYYGSTSFKDKILYEDSCVTAEWINLSEEECKKLNIQTHVMLFPWENIENEKTHPDDLEDNIFF